MRSKAPTSMKFICKQNTAKTKVMTTNMVATENVILEDFLLRLLNQMVKASKQMEILKKPILITCS